MKMYLDNQRDLPKDQRVYITDIGFGYNQEKCILNYFWIGSEAGGCIGVINKERFLDAIRLGKKK